MYSKDMAVKEVKNGRLAMVSQQQQQHSSRRQQGSSSKAKQQVQCVCRSINQLAQLRTMSLTAACAAHRASGPSQDTPTLLQPHQTSHAASSS